MLNVNGVAINFDGQNLFSNVNLQFLPGNCYGIIGANGAGKSQFLKILSGELQPNSGDVILSPGERLSVLKQDHFLYDDYDVISTVIMGNKRLYDVMQEKEALYSKPDFTDEDGIRAAELEGEFAEMDGWDAESSAQTMLNQLGVTEDKHTLKMAELDGNDKVKVLLAQALFGNPDIILLDEPTNHLDIKYQLWLMDIVKELSCTVVSAVHDLNIAAMYCDYLYAMKDGRVVAQGTPKELLTPKLIRTLYDVDSKISIDEDGMMHIFYYPSSLAKKEVLS